MELVTRSVPEERICIVGFGDWHVGSANANKDLLLEMRERIIENGWYWLMMGDAAECITVKDERWASGGIDEELLRGVRGVDYFVDRQMEYIREFVRPIIDRCLVWHEGNHEAKYAKSAGHSPILEGVLSPLGVRHLWRQGSQNTAITLPNGARVLLNSAHGSRTAQYVGTLVNWQILRLRTYDDVDVLLRGHHHHNFVVKVANIHTTKSKRPVLKDREALVVGTGSALRTLQSGSVCYAEVADMQPVVLGWPVVGVEVDGKDVRLWGTT